MKILKVLSILVVFSVFLSCSKEETKLEIVYTTSARPLIPGVASSCVAKKNITEGTPIEKDISSAYFDYKKLTLNRREYTKTLVISFIRLTLTLPTGENYTCEYGGEALAALHTSWWTAQEAIIPAGTQSFSTDCSLICGGVEVTDQVTMSGSMEVFGYEYGADLQEQPIKLQSPIMVQSF